MKPFWETKTLAQMSADEWESLCDGCAKCCLHKLEDEDDGAVYYTDVACQYLNLLTGRCRDYVNRQSNVPNCVSVTPSNINDMTWLPDSCAYKRLERGQGLASWHPLIAKNAQKKMLKKGVSVLGRVVSETDIPEALWQERVIYWVDNT